MLILLTAFSFLRVEHDQEINGWLAIYRYLYNILLDGVIVRSNPAVLILAHKQDQAMAKGSTLLQTNLEREL